MTVKELSLFSGYSVSRIYEHLQLIRQVDDGFALDDTGVTKFTIDEAAAYRSMLRTIEEKGSVKKGIVTLFKTLGKFEYLKSKKEDSYCYSVEMSVR